MDVWSYKIRRDYGFAPNPFHGFCTLACCKPGIRKGAKSGDLIFGFGSAALKMRGRLIFAMCVSETLTFDQYWADGRFARRQPVFTAGTSRSYGDNIYHHVNGAWRQEDSHHSFPGGVWNAANADRDLSVNVVLISTDFAYWGRSATDIPEHLRNHNGENLFADVRDYRRDYSDEFKNVVSEWFDKLPKGRFGRPASWH
jgi:hypothetical protein